MYKEWQSNCHKKEGGNIEACPHNLMLRLTEAHILCCSQGASVLFKSKRFQKYYPKVNNSSNNSPYIEYLCQNKQLNTIHILSRLIDFHVVIFNTLASLDYLKIEGVEFTMHPFMIFVPLHTWAKSRDHEIVRAQKKVLKGCPTTPPKSCSLVMDLRV